MTTIASRLAHVRARIEAACRASGRPVQDVTLLAVSKTFDAAAVRAAHAAGARHFGENHAQPALAKMRECGPLEGAAWHFIGPLQSNKTRAVAEHFQWVHTVDRPKIAERLSAQRPAHLPPLEVCIQVNIDGGPNKSGVAPHEAAALARAVKGLPRLALRGIMTIPEPAADFEAARAVHLRAKALLDALNAEGLALDTLSMGMSADLEAAICAGSTMVRVGSAIFGARAPG